MEFSGVLHDFDWFECRAVVGDCTYEFAFGRLQDSLTDLVDAAILLAKGGDWAQVRFDNEPPEIRMTLKRSPGSHWVALSFDEFSDFHANEDAPMGTPALAGIVRVRDFCTAVFKLLAGLQLDPLWTKSAVPGFRPALLNPKVRRLDILALGLQ